MPPHAVQLESTSFRLSWSLGGWSEEAAATISRIVRLLGQRLGLPMSETTRHLFQMEEGECHSLALPSALSFSFCRWIFMTIFLFILYLVLCIVFFVPFGLFFFVLCLCIAVALISHFCFVFCPHFSFHFSFVCI